ncbi:hypothetical protein GPJ56_004111 [Histomonas meleagridis]|uniref:uncharacterized protein n=1 Tax=Histomonas meleagridis TaxID=135588 RepID=UPI00355A5135|nr:hypothetical protein GPJ56_004111 [Histomonas meleagridis]KAH0801452.1 hypothetical protein GO595_005704 [Histomonas meleagridis]
MRNSSIQRYPSGPINTEQQEIDKFTTDRRMVFGQRIPPLQLEKMTKLPKADKHLTCYAQADKYSVSVLDGNTVVCKQQASPQPKQYEHKFDYVIDAISASPIPGYLLLIPRSGLKVVNFKLINQASGPIIDVSTDDIAYSTTAVCWIEERSQLLILVGSNFGQIMCLTIKPLSKDVSIRKLYTDENKTPIASIATITCHNSRYILYTTCQSLVILQWPGTSSEPTRLRRITKSNICIPSFVYSNSEYVSFLSLEELRIYTFDQLIDEFPGSYGVKISDIPSNILSKSFLYNKYSPLIMTKYYTLIVDKNVVLGFSNEECRLVFHYPILKEQQIINITIDISRTEKLSQIYFTTAQYIYKIDITNEEKYKYIPTLREEKEKLLKDLEPSENVSTSELLSTLLEKEDYDNSIELLINDLQKRIEQQNQQKKVLYVKKSYDEPLPQEKLSLLCEQFLILELQIINACKYNNPELFDPIIYVDTEGKYDILKLIIEMLQLRAFSPVSKVLSNPNVLNKFKNSNITLNLLLENDNIQLALNKIIEQKPSQSLLSSIIFNKKFTNLIFKDLTTKEKVNEISSFLISLLPYLSETFPSEIAFQLLEKEIKTLNSKHCDMLIWCITNINNNNSNDFDQKLYELLKDNNGFKHLNNPYSTLQRCLTSKYYRTSAYLAYLLGLYHESINCAKNIDVNTIKHYIRRSPRSIQAELCREADVELEQEGNEQAIRIASKETLVKELTSMKKKLKLLKKQSQENVHFLQDLDEWVSGENPMQESCAYCGKILNNTVGFYFPCGHCLHEDCLMCRVKELLSEEEITKIEKLFADKKAEKDILAAENMIAEDCPICGMRAAKALRKSIVKENDRNWPMSILELKLNMTTA